MEHSFLVPDSIIFDFENFNLDRNVNLKLIYSKIKNNGFWY